MRPAPIPREKVLTCQPGAQKTQTVMIKFTLVVEEVNGAVLPHVDFSKAGKATQLEIEVLRELKIHELPGFVGFAAKSYLTQETAKRL